MPAMDEDTSKYPSQDRCPSEKALCRKIDRHLLPALFLLAIIISADGVSIGNARLVGLERDLRMSPQDFSIAVTVYFIPCIVVDYPTNMLLRLSRPPLFLCGAAFLCGIVTLSLASVQNFAGLVACRVLLGLGETAFQSGAIYLIATYYPGAALHSRMSPFLVFRLMGRALGGLLAFASAHMDGVRGLSAWRWLFILEGSISMLCALICLWLIPEWPEAAKFLSRKEKKYICPTQLDHSSLVMQHQSHLWLFKRIARSPQVLLGIAIQFCCTTIAISSSVFLPTILRGLGWISFKAFFMSIPIFLAAVVVAVINGVASDHYKRRYPFCAGPLTFVVVAFGLLLAGDNVRIGVRYMACFFLTSGSFAGHSTALTWLSNNLTGRKARGMALGLVGSIGNCGYILGSNIYLQSEAPFYLTGFGICMALSVVAIFCASGLLLYLVQSKKTWDSERMYPLLNAIH